MKIALVVVGVILGGCAYDRAVVVDDTYSRAEVDARSAEAQCKLLARNLVQIARCEVRR